MNWKAFVIALVCLVAVGAGTRAIVLGQTNLKVVHKEEVPQTYDAEAERYVAGEKEHYLVYASPALVWEYVGKFSKGARIAAIVVAIFLAVYIGGVSAGKWLYSHGKLFGLTGIAVALWVAAVSSAIGAENKVKLTPQEYEAAKGDLKALFTGKKLIL